MKKILEHYATAVIAVVVALAVITAFYRFSFHQTQGVVAATGRVLGATLQKEEWKQKTGKNFDLYISHILPNISVRNINALHVGEAILVTDLFKAEDGAGDVLPVEVKECWNEKGDVVELLTPDKRSLLIPYAGTYWIRASATDNSGFTKEIIVKVFANER